MDENVNIVIKSSSGLKTINYVVIGRTGKMLTNVKYIQDLNEFEISFAVETWMIPEVHVLVYYIHFTGEVVYDTVTVNLDGSLPNNVSVVIHFFTSFNKKLS